MRNPLRSEAEAYRFLWITIAYFAAIVVASLVGGRWWGVAVFVLLTAVGAWFLLRREETGEMTRAIPSRESAPDEPGASPGRMPAPPSWHPQTCSPRRDQDFDSSEQSQAVSKNHRSR